MSAHLADVPTAELSRLLRGIEQGRLSAPLRAAELHAEGLPAAALAAVLGSLERSALITVLAALVIDRERRVPPHLDLVWTGPELRGATSRDTAVLVRELFAHAQRSVLIAGFSFDHGNDIFAPLHTAMKDRGVTTEIYLDIREPLPPGMTPSDHAKRYLTRFLGRNWGFGAPFPSLHFDPRSAEESTRTSLHAKCIVVDGETTLVTSANFTDRGHTRNIELGVLIDDPELAGQIVRQWRSLAQAGYLVEGVPGA